MQTAEEIESYEGVLVKLDNVTISSVNQYDWAITDASGFEALIDDDMATMLADNAMSEFVEGQELEYVSGIFNYSYGTFKVQIRDMDDIGQTLGVNDEATNIAYNYSLHDNYPNPFNPYVNIAYELPEAGQVKVEIVNLLGQNVKTLINDMQSPGSYVYKWNGKDANGTSVNSGMYFAIINRESERNILKITYLK